MSRCSAAARRARFVLATWLVAYAVHVCAAVGETIYTRLEPPLTISPPGSLDLDVDNDGSAEFTISLDLVWNLVFEPVGNGWGTVHVSFPQYPYARAYAPFEPIRCTHNFQPGEVVIADSYYTSPWVGRVNGFLALRFVRNGRFHLGWARMDVSAYNGRPLVKDYAYNSIPEDEPGGCIIQPCVVGAPTITCPPAISVDCGTPVDPANTGTPNVGGNCSLGLTITHTDSAPPTCGTTITRTWTATTGSGASASCQQQITILPCTAPTIACPPNVTIPCGSSIDPSVTGTPTVGGTCDVPATVTFVDSGPPDCGTTITRTWSARFGGGPVVTCVQTITLAPTPTTSSSCRLDRLVGAPALTDDWLGYSVGLSGDWIALGAPRLIDTVPYNDIGSVFVFQRQGVDWVQRARLLASDGSELDAFGFSVGIDGDYLVVGAPQDDVAGSNSGSAYIFQRQGTNWTQVAKITPSDGSASDLFGLAVAISGDYLVATAPGDNPSGNASGSAYVFHRSGGAWGQQTKIVAADGAAGDQFGIAAAIDGDSAIVGAHLDDLAAGADVGSAYVFTRSGTVWSQQVKLTAAGGLPADRFGASVGISADRAVVGAPLNDANGLSAGLAYVFTRAGTVWTQHAVLAPSDPGAGEEFGRAVALHGTTVLVGAPFDTSQSVQRGAGYYFALVGNTWTEQAKLIAGDVPSVSRFGAAVDVEGSLAVLGAPLDDPAASNSGSGHVYFVGPGPDCNQNSVVDYCDIAAGTSADANHDGVPDECAPASADCGGDLNGDGVADGADVAAFLDCYLQRPAADDRCRCDALAARGQGDLKPGTVTEFVGRLLAAP